MSYSDSFFCEEPPTVKGSDDRCAQQGPLASGAASTAATEILNIPVDGEAWVTFVVKTNPVFIHFGEANIAAADTNSAPLAVGKYRFRVQYRRRYFRVIQDTAAGSVSWWVSNRV
jgi:hypothetical protein